MVDEEETGTRGTTTDAAEVAAPESLEPSQSTNGNRSCTAAIRTETWTEKRSTGHRGRSAGNPDVAVLSQQGGSSGSGRAKPAGNQPEQPLPEDVQIGLIEKASRDIGVKCQVHETGGEDIVQPGRFTRCGL